jgi:CHASE3 domain sensor protein
MSRVTDGETGERGFLITGNDTYLEPYVLFTSTIEEIYANLLTLTAGEAIQQRELTLLRSLLTDRKDELLDIIQLRRVFGLDIARASTSFGQGKTIVTISLGVAVAVPTVRGLCAELLLCADRALYQAKHAGRAQVKTLHI